MPTMTLQRKLGGDGFNFYHESENRLYQRIAAGFVPPAERPGAVIVLGEESTWRPPAIVHWLAESREQTLDMLIERALDLQREYKIQDFYGRTSDKGFMNFLSLRNRGAREKRMAEFQINSAPNSNADDISYHINILRNRLSPNNKTLHLGKSKFLPAALKELALDKIATATEREFPVVAALGYAVSALTEWEYIEGRGPTQAITDYDVLNYGFD